ncbi:MAG: glycine cleavage system protein GcvH [Ignavibacteria bacterium]|nr:glycine cleavage system protein GcvH [Ignavibacteria bacterium]
MKVIEGLKYTKDHEYVKLENGVGIVGITDYAQNELGDIIFVDVTVSIGSEVKQGDVVGSIEAVKTVAEVFSPISGKIVEINSQIKDNAAILNQDPYGEGWILKIEPSNQEELDNLLDSEAYSKLIGL